MEQVRERPEPPPEVVAGWRAAAADPAERQRQQHEANDHGQPLETCWYCGRQRAVCKSKIRYELADALDACDEINQPSRDRLVVPYRCHWSAGLHWHLTTATTTAARRRARKRMARLHRSSL